MREIIMSLRQQWWEKSASGIKKLEVRKTMPKEKDFQLPVKVYYYIPELKTVMGYAVVDRIDIAYADKQYCKESCLTFAEMTEYANGKKLYFWHQKFVKAYDEPYKLSDFGIKRAPQSWQYISSSKKENTEKEFAAYTDGSFNKNKGIYGSGVVMFTDKQEELHFQSSGSKYSQYWNVAGEVEAAKLAIEKAKGLGCTKLTIHHDYEGVGCWATGYWRAKNDYTQEYVRYTKECGLKLSFVHVKGHSGNKYNEMADSIASKASGFIQSSVLVPNTKHTGSLEAEAQAHKTSTICIKNIRELHSKQKLSFGDFLKLKVGGKDYWSDISFAELLIGIPEEYNDILEEKGFSANQAASALRWLNRGLTFEEAIRKIEVDIEIAQKCQ